jgi:hypothetical protein
MSWKDKITTTTTCTGLADRRLVEVYYQFRTRRNLGSASPCRPACPRLSGGLAACFVGEDRIMHTPKDETLNVKIGNAFDVRERKQTDFTKIATNVYEFEYGDHAPQSQGERNQCRGQ